MCTQRTCGTAGIGMSCGELYRFGRGAGAVPLYCAGCIERFVFFE